MADEGDFGELPEGQNWEKAARGALQMAGVVPFAGGVFSALAGAWSEREQARINKFLHAFIEMMRDQILAFRGEETVAETQAQMLERYQQSL